jgi:hypothetical protein
MSGTTKETPKKLSRDEARAKILGAKIEIRPITFFGVDIELRQPTLGTILDMREAGLAMNGMKMLTDYAYLAGSDEKLFESTDEEGLRNLPFGPDVQNLMNEVATLLGVKQEGLEALVKDALKRAEAGGSAPDTEDEHNGAVASSGGGDGSVAAEQTA